MERPPSSTSKAHCNFFLFRKCSRRYQMRRGQASDQSLHCGFWDQPSSALCSRSSSGPSIPNLFVAKWPTRSPRSPPSLLFYDLRLKINLVTTLKNALGSRICFICRILSQDCVWQWQVAQGAAIARKRNRNTYLAPSWSCHSIKFSSLWP
jgi:hypothetical protein